MTGTGENSEFGEVFKMMKAEEVFSMTNYQGAIKLGLTLGFF